MKLIKLNDIDKSYLVLDAIVAFSCPERRKGMAAGFTVHAGLFTFNLQYSDLDDAVKDHTKLIDGFEGINGVD